MREKRQGKKLELPVSLSDVQRELCRRSLFEFVKRGWHVLEPSTRFLNNWHIELICEHLQSVPDKTRRLIINIPPRYMKSLLVSVFWPCWLWLNNPGMRFMFCSYSSSLSLKHSVDRATLIESEWYQKLINGAWKMRRDQNTREYRVNTAGGSMATTSVGGSATGKGGDVIVIDDPMDPKRALSDSERESTLRWIDQTLLTRLNDPKHGAIVLIMQRLHEADVTGHFLRTKQGWTHLRLPSPATEDQEIVFPVSGRQVLFKAGEPLWPEREGKPDLERKKIDLGGWAFAGQYLQQPTPLGGGVFKRDWFRYYEPGDLQDVFQLIVASWDLTFKDSGESRVAGEVWGISENRRFLLDVVVRKMGFLESIRAIRELHNRWNPHATLVEDKANGPAVLEVLGKEIPGLIPVTPEGSKIERAQAVAPQVEAGNVLLPKDAPWTEEVLYELCNFPSGAHDDLVDAMSQALLYCRSYGPNITVNRWQDSIQTVAGAAAGLSW